MAVQAHWHSLLPLAWPSWRRQHARFYRFYMVWRCWLQPLTPAYSSNARLLCLWGLCWGSSPSSLDAWQIWYLLRRGSSLFFPANPSDSSSHSLHKCPSVARLRSATLLCLLTLSIMTRRTLAATYSPQSPLLDDDSLNAKTMFSFTSVCPASAIGEN